MRIYSLVFRCFLGLSVLAISACVGENLSGMEGPRRTSASSSLGGTSPILGTINSIRDSNPRNATAATALNVRIQGLALGAQVTLGHGNETLVATLNEPMSFTPQVAAGAPLDLRVVAQPAGQNCAVSDQAPAYVPADGSPVFVRCVSLRTFPVILPDTQPNDTLRVNFDIRDSAYPGIPYESRPGVLGGIFPYEYRILSLTLDGVAQSTAGVSLDFRRGTVRFTPPSEGTYVLTLDIRDSGSTKKRLQRSFTIQSAASSFLFVSTDGVDAAGRGSRAAPYRTLAYAIANSTASQLIMLRKGTYLTGGFSLNDNRAKQILAYPDEVVTLNLNQSGNISVNSAAMPMPRIEGVDITAVKQYGIVSDPSRAGLVIRNVRFVDGIEGDRASENPAFILGWGDSPTATRHKLLIQDNDFGIYTMKTNGAYAMVFFDAGQSLIENNQIRLGATTGGIHEKDNSQHNTHRENFISFSASKKVSGGIQVSAQANSDNVHIHHNLLINAGVYLGLQCFSASCYMREHNVHHNTLAGGSVFVNWGPFNPTSNGTRVTYNIISSGSSAPYAGLSCQSRPAGLGTQMAASTNLIESSHALAFKDSECSGNDMSWATWQGTYGFDTAASGSSLSSTSGLVGSGPLIGLPMGDSRRGLRGHQLLYQKIRISVVSPPNPG